MPAQEQKSTGGAMSLAERYRQQAREAELQARDAKDAQTRNDLLQIARAYGDLIKWTEYRALRHNAPAAP